jgi:exosortase F-associated protein
MQHSNSRRIVIGILCVAGLASVYLFQRIDVASMLGMASTPAQKFIVNRSIRFILNDTFMIGIIYALFRERKYVVFALWVQALGIAFLLIPYFLLKIRWPHYNGPLISFLHRLILNPTLMLLLIPAFYYQRRSESPNEP